MNTIGQIFLNRINPLSQDAAIKWIKKGVINTVSHQQYFETIELLASAIRYYLPQNQSKVSILSNTRKEWHYFDLAIIASGNTVIPIYQTYTAKEVEYIFNHSESEIIIIENLTQFKKLTQVASRLSKLKAIVTIEKIDKKWYEEITTDVDILSYNDFLRIGYSQLKEFSLKESFESLNKEDIATIIYTSGTTGEPKGAVITQLAFATLLVNLKIELGPHLGEGDRTLTFLPLSHVLGRCDSMLFLALGVQNIYAESIERVIENISLAKPTMMIAVPRIFEKIHAKVKSSLEAGGPIKKKVFLWAQKISNDYYAKVEKNLAPSPKEIALKKLAYEIVYSKVYQRFGGEIKVFVSGGAPISIEIMNFLRNANLPILEGYGLTETVSACAINPMHKQMPGHVGVPFGDIQLKIAQDGEILVKTGQLFSGYFKNPEATEEALIDGWFKTGDIGEFNNEGYLKITDRKKDLIITSGGKNVAPQKIENLMKGQDLISNFVVIGEKKNYLTGIVSVSLDEVRPFLKSEGLERLSNKELSTSNKFNKLVRRQVDQVNKHLARYESIKKITISPFEFTVESGMLTPSMKVKRKEVSAKFQAEIESMY